MREKGPAIEEAEEVPYALRREAPMTQGSRAKKGISVQAVSRWEGGLHPDIGLPPRSADCFGHSSAAYLAAYAVGIPCWTRAPSMYAP